MMLSIIVVVYDMAIQAANTVESLSPEYQRQISADDYEVIVVENQSSNLLPQSVITHFPGNIRYFLRDETSQSPAAAINFAFDQCQGEFIGLSIDGARMLTPGVLHFSQRCFQLSENAMVMVPAYHLGDTEHSDRPSDHRSISIEQEYLNDLLWRQNGYRLFERCAPSPGNRTGYMSPFFECSMLFAHRRHFQRTGPADLRFNLAGGGALNLHILRTLGTAPEMAPFVLVGEGSFHQQHGGVTTQSDEQHQAKLASFKQQLDEIWQGQFRPLARQPTLIGSLADEALPMLEHANHHALKRYKNCNHKGKPYWGDDA